MPNLDWLIIPALILMGWLIYKVIIILMERREEKKHSLKHVNRVTLERLRNENIERGWRG